jgi:hypothetical protein
MDSIKTVALAVLLASSCFTLPEVASAQTGQSGQTPPGCETITDENRATCTDPDEGSDRDQGEMTNETTTGGGVTGGNDGDDDGGGGAGGSDAGGGNAGGGGGAGGGGNN